MPEARRGNRHGVVRNVLTEAAPFGKNVTIHVEKNNPARTLYARLGFTILDEDRGAYDCGNGARPLIK